MEFVFIVGIIIAVIGALTIFAVVWQGSDASGAAESPDARSTSDTPPSPTEKAIPTAQSAAEVETAKWVESETPPFSEPSPADITPPEETPLTIESITALYAHANDDEVAPAETSLRINVADVLATQIEQLYADYVRLEEEREKLARALLTNMLFEKIERSAGRLEVTTERETLDLREKFSKVSADYDRVQFRLGSLQHLNMRLTDPRVAQQLEELVLEIKRIASKT